MSLVLRQIHVPRQRLDFRGVLPPVLGDIDPDTLLKQTVFLGKQGMPLGELFSLDGEPGNALTLIPADDRLDHVGHGLREGELTIQGPVGHYTGAQLDGGRIVIEGDCGDYAGSGLRKGELIIGGRAGDRLGAPAAGERQGQRGGLIRVRGDVGCRAAEAMRRGLVIIEGDAGDYLAHRMIAGTVYLGGRCGEYPGLGLRRGSLLLRKTPDHLGSTFRHNGRHQLGYLPLLLRHIRGSTAHALDLPETTQVDRYLGDVANGGSGEILIMG